MPHKNTNTQTQPCHLLSAPTFRSVVELLKFANGRTNSAQAESSNYADKLISFWHDKWKSPHRIRIHNNKCCTFSLFFIWKKMSTKKKRSTERKRTTWQYETKYISNREKKIRKDKPTQSIIWLYIVRRWFRRAFAHILYVWCFGSC